MSVPISGMSNASPHHPIGPIRRVVKVLQEVKEPGLMQSIFLLFTLLWLVLPSVLVWSGKMRAFISGKMKSVRRYDQSLYILEGGGAGSLDRAYHSLSN